MNDTTQSVSPPDKADAKNRAWRTFLQGFLVDVGVAIATFVMGAIAAPDFVWSRQHLALLGGALAKTLLMAAAAYVMRLKMLLPNTARRAPLA